MTIVEAIKTVLNQVSEGLTTKEIYSEIIKQNLYQFGAKNPVGVVNNQIRRRCVGLDFPTAYPQKIFRIVGYQDKKIKFDLCEDTHFQENVLSYERNTIEKLPEEKIEIALNEHLLSLKQQILDSILNSSPKFFEQLVIDLLLKMGYGYGKQAGEVTGRSHDGGIDGVISEDKLGLDMIYIQAKRYTLKNKIGRNELQAFIGAMQYVRKGVFITTSSFTKEAKEFVNKQQQKNIKLIDGELLSELLVQYEVGILKVKNVIIYKVDTDYFDAL